MQKDESTPSPVPPDCFALDELEQFKSVENQALVDVNYYLWFNQKDSGPVPQRFLYVLELIFEGTSTLLLSSGEDSLAIRLVAPEMLIRTAQQLQTLHGQPALQRMRAGTFALWQPLVGEELQAIRLSKSENGLYLNDALVLDFGSQQILVQLSPKEGLEIGPYKG